MRQGCCTLPPDASGRVCDRLAGLEQVIDSQMVRQVLSETGQGQSFFHNAQFGEQLLSFPGAGA